MIYLVSVVAFLAVVAYLQSESNNARLRERCAALDKANELDGGVRDGQKELADEWKREALSLRSENRLLRQQINAFAEVKLAPIANVDDGIEPMSVRAADALAASARMEPLLVDGAPPPHRLDRDNEENYD